MNDSYTFHAPIVHGGFVWALFCGVIFIVFSSFAVFLPRKRELVALLDCALDT